MGGKKKFDWWVNKTIKCTKCNEYRKQGRYSVFQFQRAANENTQPECKDCATRMCAGSCSTQPILENCFGKRALKKYPGESILCLRCTVRQGHVLRHVNVNSRHDAQPAHP